MRKGIHPDYKEAKITCACGNTIDTRATQEEMHTEICSSCHPFFTGKQKFVDTAGRVEKFQTRYGNAWKEKHKKVKPQKATPAEVVEAKTTTAKAPKTETTTVEATDTEPTETAS